VPDDHGVACASEHIVEHVGVAGHCTYLVATVRGDLRRGIPPQERGDGVESGVGQLRKEKTPGVSRVGKPMEAQREGTVGRSLVEVGELQPIDRYRALIHGDLT
jgi:hypothetical protein